jgi:HSP20 family molecular chaperone IbpA
MEDLAMRTTYDFAPLWRSTIGFDRLFDLVDAAQQAGSEDNCPPCNVERLAEDRYQISLAVAGFSADEIAITAEQSVLTVEGQKSEKQKREFLYQGISSRALQTAVQSGGLCPGQGSHVRQRLAADRTGAGDPGGHEAAPDFDRRLARFERPAD